MTPRDAGPGGSHRGWRFWIDRGGTFTDLVARSPSGELVVRKVLSVQPEHPGDPAVRAMREVLGLPTSDQAAASEPLPVGLIEEVRLGTTVATNALLEHRGVPSLLLVNRGLADLLLIGDQHRPDLFALEIVRPEPLARQVLEVGGRLSPAGEELEPLQLDDALADRLRQARAAGVRSVAVALLHAYRHPRHERQLGAWLERFGFAQIALSHRVSPLPRLVPRGHTTVLEATVGPVLHSYLQQVQAALGDQVRLRVMQSSGILIDPPQLRAKDTILSGPAGGLVGAVRCAQAVGIPVIVGFDMGGTSTDVCYSDGSFERREQVEVAGLPLQAPMLPIHTVAAGGGSCLHFDGQRLQVGPRSAGADPGPACYRRGGPLTLTDANLLLGRLRPEVFPAVFGPRADQPLDRAIVQRRFAALGQAMGCSPEAAAEGAVAIAVERMAEAIRRVSIQQGHDVRQATLCSFGGAGGQHACALAEALGMAQVLLHPLAGVLSAYGIGLADEGRLLEEAVGEPLSDALLQAVEQRIEALAQGAPARRQLLVRTPGSDHSLPVAWGSAAEVRAAFLDAYRSRYGYGPSGPDGAPARLVLERFSLEVLQPLQGEQALPPVGSPPASAPVPPATPAVSDGEPEAIEIVLQGAWRPAALWRRCQLRPGMVLQGPALIVEPTGTNLLLPGWTAHTLPGGELLLRHGSPPAPAPLAAAGLALPAAAAPLPAPAPREASALQPTPAPRPPALDPVTLELFHHRFAAIAEQMGCRLQQTSASVNIKERLDFSCALFDGQGALVANAPHIPVHLGSMGESVAALLAAIARGERPPLAPGDVVVSNNPYNGGTHLPDLTVITPVFAGGDQPSFHVASRGHHSDVGGITPGSMPPHSRLIHEEGLLLDNVFVVRQGVFQEPSLRERLAEGPWPVRNPDQLLADLQAQVAANQLGVERLEDLVAREGLARVQACMAQVQAHAAEAVRRVIDRLADGEARVPMDGGLEVVLRLSVDRRRRRALLDFSGTSPQQPGNLNAPLAITKAAVLYAFRCLVAEPIPLNAGCFEPLELRVPPGCLLNPRPPAAVVAGNVETSQAVANALFAALGVMAAAQGTMNNVSFGHARCQYYETLCGGTGAGPGFAGASAVQSHMTNSRLTDPEIFEQRLPVRLERFAIRRGSGGAGTWPGGDGVIREWTALEPLTLSLLTGSRQVPPFGLAGGEAGACGVNTLVRADGSRQSLAGVALVELQPGDRLRIETPGGGGYGPPPPGAALPGPSQCPARGPTP